MVPAASSIVWYEWTSCICLMTVFLEQWEKCWCCCCLNSLDVLWALVGEVMATLMVELQSNHHHNCYYQMPGFKITTQSDAEPSTVHCTHSTLCLLTSQDEFWNNFHANVIFCWNQALEQEVCSDTLSLTFFSNRVIFFSNTSNSLFLFTLEKPQGDKYSPDEIK